MFSVFSGVLLCRLRCLLRIQLKQHDVELAWTQPYILAATCGTYVLEQKTSAGSSRGCQNFSAIAAHCAAGPGAPPDQQHHPTSYWSIIPIPLGPATHLSKEVIQGPVNPEAVSWVGLWIMLAVDADPGKVGHGV